MANDLYSPDSGNLQPYSPGGDLAPVSPADSWGNTDVDLLDNRFERGFGQLDPQVEANVAAIATVFETDMASLGYVQADIRKCVNWFKQSLSNPPTKMPRKAHTYETWQFSHDPAFQAFCNYAATQRFPQALIQSVAYWLQQLEDFQHGTGRFAGQQVSQTAVSSDPLDSLNDAQYEAVVVANERAAANTMGRLKDLWGSSFQANMRVVQNHFAALTDAEQEHLSQYSSGWIKGTNTYEILVSLYAEAVQAHTIPRNGAAIAQELQNIERYMKERRAAYMKDETTQARYRELLNLRDGGR